MPIVSRKEAMKLTGKSHATIYRHLRSGKLSKNSDGGIDTSELLRVYGPFVSTDINDTHIDTEPNIIEVYQQEKTDTEIKMLKDQIEMLKSHLTKTENLLKHQQEQGDKLLNLLENRLPAPTQNEDSVINLLKKKFL